MFETAQIDLLKQGNKEAFCELVKANRKMVFNICYRFLLNKEDAEDISQEVFIEVFHSIHQFRREAKLSTWLYRIAVTKSLDEIKRLKRKKRYSSGGDSDVIDHPFSIFIDHPFSIQTDHPYSVQIDHPYSV